MWRRTVSLRKGRRRSRTPTRIVSVSPASLTGGIGWRFGGFRDGQFQLKRGVGTPQRDPLGQHRPPGQLGFGRGQCRQEDPDPGVPRFGADQVRQGSQRWGDRNRVPVDFQIGADAVDLGPQLRAGRIFAVFFGVVKRHRQTDFVVAGHEQRAGEGYLHDPVGAVAVQTPLPDGHPVDLDAKLGPRTDQDVGMGEVEMQAGGSGAFPCREREMQHVFIRHLPQGDGLQPGHHRGEGNPQRFRREVFAQGGEGDQQQQQDAEVLS